jgi:N-acetylglutamate synthase-like GNAT family acetyltransferase
MLSLKIKGPVYSQYYFDKKFLRILGLGVHEDFRLKGIARSFINHIIDLANTKECFALRLFTIKGTGNVPIFERIGFEIVGEHHDGLLEGLNGEHVTDTEMELRLTNNTADCQGGAALED